MHDGLLDGLGKALCLCSYCRVRLVDRILPIVSTAPREEGRWKTLEPLLGWCDVGMFDLARVPCLLQCLVQRGRFFLWCLLGVGEILSKGSILHGCLLPCALASKSSLLLSFFTSLYPFVFQGYRLL